MAAQLYKLGMVGLGTMGRSLVLNLADHSFAVAGYDRDLAKGKALLAESASEEAWEDIQDRFMLDLYWQYFCGFDSFRDRLPKNIFLSKPLLTRLKKDPAWTKAKASVLSVLTPRPSSSQFCGRTTIFLTPISSRARCKT